MKLDEDSTAELGNEMKSVMLLFPSRLYWNVYLVGCALIYRLIGPVLGIVRLFSYSEDSNVS